MIIETDSNTVFNSNCENHPDDGLSIPAICQEYTTEVEGGHLGAVSSGKIRVAKAFWVLMAQIAGWIPGIPTYEEKLEKLYEMKIFPNPAQDYVGVQLISNSSLNFNDDFQVLLFNNLGQLVMDNTMALLPNSSDKQSGFLNYILHICLRAFTH
jgi:hypothetical protein